MKANIQYSEHSHLLISERIPNFVIYFILLLLYLLSTNTGQSRLYISSDYMANPFIYYPSSITTKSLFLTTCCKCNVSKVATNSFLQFFPWKVSLFNFERLRQSLVIVSDLAKIQKVWSACSHVTFLETLSAPQCSGFQIQNLKFHHRAVLGMSDQAPPAPHLASSWHDISSSTNLWISDMICDFFPNPPPFQPNLDGVKIWTLTCGSQNNDLIYKK